MSDIDPVLRNALRMLHSHSTESAASIRLALDEAIRQRYGNTRRTLTEQLTKRQLAEEALASGSGIPASPLPTASGAASSRSQDSRGSSLVKDSPVRPATAATAAATDSDGGEASAGEGAGGGGDGDDADDGSELVIAVPADEAEKECVLSGEEHMEVSAESSAFLFPFGGGGGAIDR